ncbi:MAG: ATP-dependent zinc metalloprotease FtsH [bacterium]|nr:ATP-dependent zinc metalloprotease FtsH [bacterium]
MTPNLRQLWRNIVIVILALSFVSLIFSFLLEDGGARAEELTMNQVVDRVNGGAVQKITVQGNSLSIDLVGGGKATAQKEREVGLTETLVNYGVKPDALAKVALSVEDEGGWNYWLGILVPTILPIILIVILFSWMLRSARAGASQAFSFGKATIRLVAPSKDRITFKDVAGLKEAKEEMEEVVDFLKNPKKFLSMGARIPRGVLLMGHPGTGKTLLARAVAGESNVPFFHLSASEFVEMFVGVGASRVRDLFQNAKKAAPSIVFIDEIDAVGRERGTGMGGGHDEREQTLNQILVEMDGFERETNVIVMAATNRADILDSALLRPGRFDRRVVLDMPDIQDREAILKIHAKEKPLAKDVNLNQIAVRTPGFSGADLANLMNEAAILAARNGKKEIVQLDVLNSIEKVLLGPARRSRVITPHEKRVTAYHEAGHALVAASLADADPVHKVSIVSRGMAGGYTIKLPLEERRLRTKKQFLTDLAVSFGGYVAELLTFGDITTGSSNDISQATELAHRLVTQYGMNETLGPRSFGKQNDLIFLGREITSGKDYSEEVGAKIDAEVNRLIVNAVALAKKILTRQKRTLKSIAEHLIEKETIEYEEFNALMKTAKLKPMTIS